MQRGLNSVGTGRDDSSIMQNEKRLKRNNWNGKIETINEDCEGNSNEGTNIGFFSRRLDFHEHAAN